MSTIETAFRGRVPLVNLDKGSAIPFRFVFELPHKLRPTDIRDGLSEFVVFDHVLDVQTLDAYDLVLTYDLCREFVLIITPSIGYSGMDTSHLALSLPTVLTSLFLLGMSSLSLCQVLFIFVKELGIAVRMSIGSDDHALESQIKPHLLIDNRQMLDLFLYQDGDEVAIGTIFGDGYCRGFAPLGQRTRPMNIKRSVHSADQQALAETEWNRAQIIGVVWDDPTRGLPHGEQALSLARASHDRELEARSLFSLGWIHLRGGDFQQGMDCLEAALELYARLPT